MGRFRAVLWCTGGLAELVWLTPLLRALREARPDARLSLVCREDTAPLLAGADLADDMETLPAAAGAGGPRLFLPRFRPAWRRVARYLEEEPCRLGFIDDLDESSLYHAAMLFRRAGVETRIGYVRSGWAGTALSDPLDCRPFLRFHPSVRFRHLFQVLDLNGHEAAPDLRLRPEERRAARAALADAGVDVTRPVVVLHPEAARPSLCWPEEHWTSLAAGLRDAGLQVLLLGGGEGARSPGAVPGSAHLAEPLPPRPLAALLARGAALAAPDCDAVQFAVAVGTPTVALFGPSDPAVRGPLGSRHQILSARPEGGGPGRGPLSGLEVEPVLQALRAAIEQPDEESCSGHAGPFPVIPSGRSG